MYKLWTKVNDMLLLIPGSDSTASVV